MLFCRHVIENTYKIIDNCTLYTQVASVIFEGERISLFKSMRDYRILEEYVNEGVETFRSLSLLAQNTSQFPSLFEKVIVHLKKRHIITETVLLKMQIRTHILRLVFNFRE